jgi:hypothetical protein
MSEFQITGKAKLVLQCDYSNNATSAIEIETTVRIEPGEVVDAVVTAIDSNDELAKQLVAELASRGMVPDAHAFAERLFEYYRYAQAPDPPAFVLDYLQEALGKVPR